MGATAGVNVHVYPSYFTNESRILRIVRTLHEHGVWRRFVLVGIHREGLAEREEIAPGIVLLRVRPAFGNGLRGMPGLLAKGIGWHAAVVHALRGEPLACVNAHSVTVLPLGMLLKVLNRSRLVYDTHELETETVGSRGWRRPLLRAIERLFIGRCDAVVTVNESIASWYRERHGTAQVAVVRNMPHSAKLAYAAPSGRLRAAAGVPTGARLHLYQGFLTVGRGLELLLDVFRDLGASHHLVLLGYGPLEASIRDAAAASGNIHFVPAVPPEEVLEYTSDADVGLSLIEDVCLSYRLSLPNKVFEYAAAGVPSLVSDFPEMAAFVARSGAGWAVAPDHHSLLRRLRTLTDEELARARALLRTNRQQFDWSQEVPALLAVYARLGFAPSGQQVAAS